MGNSQDPREPDSAPSSDPYAGSGEGEHLTNDDIEALLREMGGVGAPTSDAAAESPRPDLLSNEDIAALFEDVAPSEPEPSPPSSAEPIPDPPPAPEEPSSHRDAPDLLSPEDLESLLADSDVLASASDDEPPVEPPSDEISADDIDALVARFGADAPPATPPAKAPAPASPAPPDPKGPSEDLLPQDMIDSLLQETRPAPPAAAEPPEEPAASPAPPESAEAVSPPAPLPAEDQPDPAPVPRRRMSLSAKATVSLAVGLVTTGILFAYLQSHPYRIPEWASLSATADAEAGEGGPASAPLEASGDPADEVATFDQLEQQYRVLPKDAKIPVVRALQDRIDRAIAAAPTDPRVPEALSWKARLYLVAEMPQAARDVFREVIADYPESPAAEDAFIEAARTALEVGQPADAFRLSAGFLEKYPDSERIGEAQLLLGEAHAAAGDREAARELLQKVAQDHPDSPLGADAFARLGQFAFDEGSYDEAIRLLETRLETATRIAGNDRIYLQLARAHRAQGQLDEAEQVLRELVDFFPDSPVLPEAMVELSRLLDDRGKRSEAVRIARQAQQRYPDDADVLAEAGRLLAEVGDTVSAAETLSAAGEVGGGDPVLLLDAARQLRASHRIEEALETYDRLETEFATTPQAIEAGIETARLRYGLGEPRAALAKLEDLADRTRGRVQHPHVLEALAAMYRDVGLRERSARLYREAAAESEPDEHELRARAAVALFEAGAEEDGLAVARRVDPALLSDETAYRFLMAHGATLLRADSESAIARMEEAYRRFPELRTAQDEQRLLKAYLVLDRIAAARAVVSDIEARVQAVPVDAPRLLKAASVFGDHLYRRGDFRAAADAYALGVDANRGFDASLDRTWCEYQWAGALLRLEEFAEALPLLEQVAESDSPWSETARLKAEWAKTELRRRGQSAPVSDAAPREG